MAPFSLMAAGVGLLARSVSVLSCTNTLARCTAVPASYLVIAKAVSSQATGPPKRPLNGYMRYVVQQKPAVIRQQPEAKLVDVIRQIAQKWRTLSPEEKRPFQEESQQARERFKVDLEKYQAQLTPAQTEQQVLDKRVRMAKRKALRKKRELNNLGKPKRPRSAFNIFMSEHFEEARGTGLQGKMKSLVEEWKNMFSHQKQVYTQLAEDDKIRYKNEMKAWEDHMVEVGREDLIRQTSQSARRKTAAKKTAAKKKAAKKKKKTAARKTAATKKPEKKVEPKASGDATKTVKGGTKEA